MPEDVSENFKALSKELRDQIASLAKALGVHKQMESSVGRRLASEKQYTGILKSVYNIHDELLGGVGKKMGLLYAIINKHTTASAQSAKSLVKTSSTGIVDNLSINLAKKAEQLKKEKEAIVGATTREPSMELAKAWKDNDKLSQSIVSLGKQRTLDLLASEKASGGLEKNLIGTATASEESLASLVEEAPELIELGLAWEAIKDTSELVYGYFKLALTASRDFNKSVVESNATAFNRNRLFDASLETSIHLGISQKESRDVITEMVRQGQQFTDNFDSSVKTSVELHEGLGLSVESSIQLLSVSKLTGQSYGGLADTLAVIQQRIGLSAQDAEKMAASIGVALPFLGGTRGSGDLSGIISTIAPFAQALKSQANMPQGGQMLAELIGKIDTNATNTQRLMGGGVGEASSANSLMSRLTEVSKNISDMYEKGSPIQAEAWMHAQERLLGAGPELDPLLRNLSEAMEKQKAEDAANPGLLAARREQTDLLKVFNSQMSKSQPIFERFWMTMDSLIIKFSIPVLSSLQHLAEKVTPTLDKMGGWFDLHGKDIEHYLDALVPKVNSAIDYGAHGVLGGIKGAMMGARLSSKGHSDMIGTAINLLAGAYEGATVAIGNEKEKEAFTSFSELSGSLDHSSKVVDSNTDQLEELNKANKQKFNVSWRPGDARDVVGAYSNVGGTLQLVQVGRKQIEHMTHVIDLLKAQNAQQAHDSRIASSMAAKAAAQAKSDKTTSTATMLLPGTPQLR